MTGNDFLLDTNIVIELFAGNKSIADKIYSLPKFYLSSISLGELHTGIHRVSDKQRHLEKLSDFL